MRTRLRRLLGVATLALALPLAAAADETPAPATVAPGGVEQELQPPETGVQAAPAPATAIVPQTPGGWSEDPGQLAKQDWEDRNPWGYGNQSIFPLTRDVAAGDWPLWGKITAYPLTALYDLIQLPAGAIGGLWGN
jgi:hypothetical protein